MTMSVVSKCMDEDKDNEGYTRMGGSLDWLGRLELAQPTNGR